MQGNPSINKKPLHFWQHMVGRCCNGVDIKADASSTHSAGFARGGLTVRPRKAKPWKRHPGFS
ncbi:hypothetical protein HUG20_17040 [Salicibibacter cibi]|uniref:Uncharacterized protein n=1 Tax=Salicibibacter cibi TaxID=2743001 RepID=A0A7T6ZDD4_9BACI|nr:hypothetical protein [Salicibibacter cibi]QQK81448.1 hypothetical protein HUG20_17040 [Salicibibacter cibi]